MLRGVTGTVSGPLLSATDLGMIRGERVLFTGVSLSVAPGESLVLRGSNGAGKTTLLRILAGLTRPEAGEVTRNGLHHWFAHREGLKPHETPRTHLGLWAKAWGSDPDLDSVLARMGLKRPADVPARYLSAGQRRRTALGRLLLEKRPIWMLDEPYTALDAEGRELVLELIEAHLKSGGGVVAAIHGESGFVPASEVVL
ncbi:heme ABC exporter ATP-binding protein CcmA [uncultured Hyphomonas sp.]|uniref:heme ABC exporter ATP-binding protein CcmA n=1 Tax=uncultured Hyphomonas sp. TaxID=225298 RepID=UPI002AABB455|nr:heme ABC exporter ATP-binding protein CcmA [uncultured Hyphomonas sp.]